MKIATPVPPDNIDLLLVDPEGMDRPLSEVETSAVFAEPPYWSFCWGSGKVLAEYIFARPELVMNKSVLDFGCGSGIVGIAAALAGAGRVICCDIDRFAQMAATYNARTNGVAVEIAGDVFAVQDKIDVLFAADVLYDRENLPLLAYFRELAELVIVADSRVKSFSEPGFTLIGDACGVTEPDLGELESVKQVRFYQAISSGI